jgi:hypothetical protein
MARSTGLSVTHGEPTGVSTVSSAFVVVLTTLQLNLIAHGQFQRTHGLKVSNTLQLKPKKIVSLTTRLFTHSHNPFGHQLTRVKISFPNQVATFDGGEKKNSIHAWDLFKAEDIPANVDWRNMNGTNYLSWSKN